MGSDGLWDNLYMCQITEVIKSHVKDQLRNETNHVFNINDTEAVAKDIALLAQNRSLSKDLLVPYVANAYDYGLTVEGGKPDDISVIVAQVNLTDQYVEPVVDTTDTPDPRR